MIVNWLIKSYQWIRQQQRYRQIFGILLTVCIGFLAALFCWHLLREFNWQQIWHLIKATPAHTLQIAFLAAVGSYFMLCLYEWSAARYAGVKLNFARLMIGGTCACAIGNALGLSVLSGGAVRARLYLANGVSPWQIARMSIFASLSLGTVLPLLAASAALMHPIAAAKALHLPGVWVLFVLVASVFTLYLSVYMLLKSKPSTLSECGWSRAYQWGKRFCPLPSGRLMAWQLPITLLDMLCTASILYCLLPNPPSFSIFLMIYLLALAAGILSHIPGGLGVFELILLAAFSSTLGLLPLTVALLLYRAIYVILPFILASLVLLITEIWRFLVAHQSTNFPHKSN